MSRCFTSSIVCPHQIIHEPYPFRQNPNKKEKPDNVVPEPGFHFPFSVTLFHEKKKNEKGVDDARGAGVGKLNEKIYLVINRNKREPNRLFLN